MNICDVKSVSVSDSCRSERICLLDNEINETKVFRIELSKSQTMILPAQTNAISVFILYNGAASLQAGGTVVILGQPGAYVADPAQDLTIYSEDGAYLLELVRCVTPEEFSALPAEIYPYAVFFSEAPKYTEECKSANTTSRMIIPARIVPRFAMGSVEAHGEDLVEKHTHPMLEQFFFGLENNQCKILIESIEFPFGKNQLVHIPLGSEHGVRSDKGEVINYLWLDFLLDESGLEYMDSEHVVEDAP